MPFTVLPAIDVYDGRLSTLGPDGPRPLARYDGDPVSAARAMVEAGARWLHVVDMTLAFDGRRGSIGVLSDIVHAAPTARIQVSGGIASGADALVYLATGAARIVLGSAALADRMAAEALLRRFGADVVVGIEVSEGRIRPRGAPHVDLDLMSTIEWATTIGAPAFLVTAVDRVSGKGGPDADLIRRVVRRGTPVLAAGGIASVEDLRAVREAGAVGAVIGRAALEGDLDVQRALEWAAAR